MCGLAGVVTWDEAFRFDSGLLSRMSACVAHRGPDGEGTYLNQNRVVNRDWPQCGLTHRRLAILDLDERALQPFADPTGRYWLAFNGEIYNYRELRAELGGGGGGESVAWRTTCDTEVLLAAYLAWGPACLDRFNGMFAFAIWDDAAKTLFLARDRMGQKPLYIAWAPERKAVVFASELPALRELPWFDDTIDRTSLSEYLCRGYIGSPRSIYRRCEKLLPGHWMRISRSGADLVRYFDPNEPQLAEEMDYIGRARALITQAVGRQLVSDVPLGCFLSGGIDSSIIAAAMKQSVGKDQPVLTFSIGFDDPRYDETRYAAMVAEHIGSQHHRFVVQPNAAEDLPKLARVFGEPFADSSALPTHYLSRETRQHVKVALSGDGGDELFGGYDRYRAMQLGQRLRRVPGLSSSIVRHLARHLPGVHPKSTLTRFKRLVASLDLPPAERYAAYMALMEDTLVHRLMPDAGACDHTARLYESMLAAGRDQVQAAMATDRVSYLPDDLLAKVDRCSMLHALEVRSPFMDHEIVGFASGLPTPLAMGKRVLRQAFASDLPPEILNRRKMGFAVPIGEWFRTDLRDLLRESLFASDSFARRNLQKDPIEQMINEHERREADHTQRLYALLMLELWWRSAQAPSPSGRGLG